MKNSFKKIVLLCLLMTSSISYAKWILLDHTADGDDVYFESNSVKKNGELVDMIFLGEFKQARQLIDTDVNSSKWYAEFNCRNKTSRILSRSFYNKKMGEGKAVSTDDKTEQPQPIITGTLFDSILMTVCN